VKTRELLTKLAEGTQDDVFAAVAYAMYQAQYGRPRASGWSPPKVPLKGFAGYFPDDCVLVSSSVFDEEMRKLNVPLRARKMMRDAVRGAQVTEDVHDTAQIAGDVAEVIAALRKTPLLSRGVRVSERWSDELSRTYGVEILNIFGGSAYEVESVLSRHGYCYTGGSYYGSRMFVKYYSVKGGHYKVTFLCGARRE
jgi:hypothetical protein